MCIGCKYFQWEECTCEEASSQEAMDEYEKTGFCPHKVDYDFYRDWIRDEDAKLHYQERLME